MQQYFIDEKLELNKTISLNEDIVFHLSKVLRNSEKTFRLADKDGNFFLASLENGNAIIIDKIDEFNELSIDVIALVPLIKQDKFEIIIQKLCELGVKTIVPYHSKYCQYESFSINKIIRFNKILKEASEQSHRNFIPNLLDVISFVDTIKYKSALNIVPYEKEKDTYSTCFKSKSITFIIGPEGGFASEEIEYLKDNGFISISLGKTILRAETAAICVMSNIVRDNI